MTARRPWTEPESGPRRWVAAMLLATVAATTGEAVAHLTASTTTVSAMASREPVAMATAPATAAVASPPATIRIQAADLTAARPGEALTVTAGVAAGSSWLSATAPSTLEGNELRELLWWSTAGTGLDQTSCASWSVADGRTVQAGIALRVAVRDNVPQAITVTRNVYGGATWVFNVHLWVGRSFTLIGQIDLEHLLRVPGGPHSIPLPWRMCARTVRDRVEFKVWPVKNPEPAWLDPCCGAAVDLPDGWLYAGEAGWYLGHLYAGDRATLEDLTVTESPGPAHAT